MISLMYIAFSFVVAIMRHLFIQIFLPAVIIYYNINFEYTIIINFISHFNVDHLYFMFKINYALFFFLLLKYFQKLILNKILHRHFVIKKRILKLYTICQIYIFLFHLTSNHMIIQKYLISYLFISFKDFWVINF